jgi:hypothetical protein
VYIFHDDTGKIIAAVAADHPGVVLTRIPEGTTPLFLDDTQYADVWNNLGEYTIQNGVPVHTPIPDEVKLANAKQAKQAELKQKLQQTLLAGFTSSADGTERRYGFAPTDQQHWTWLLGVLTAGTCPNPIMVKDINGTRITMTTDQAKQLCLDAQNFYLTNYQHWDSLEQQVDNATTVDQVNAISW